jgi:hypothetical protein
MAGFPFVEAQFDGTLQLGSGRVEAEGVGGAAGFIAFDQSVLSLAESQRLGLSSLE